jgi:site-specific DNA-methyltransferase (adenine-specific)
MIRKEVTIGDCRLILGDAMAIVADLAYDCILTDPPYGMAFRSNHRDVKHDAIANDHDIDMLVWTCHLPVQHSRYVFCRWDNLYNIPKPRSLVTWVKDNWSMGDLHGEHARQTEVAAFYRGPGHYFPNGRPQDVIRAPRTGNEYHPTEKPVSLMAAFLGWSSGVALDPFMGAGSTLVACARKRRAGIGIEIDEGYFNIACERVRKAYAQPDLFILPRTPEPVQRELFLEAAE